MEIVEVKKDLLNVPNTYVLCHCISQDGTMGAGVARQICNKNQKMRETVKNEITAKNIEVGDNVYYQNPQNGRFIVNMITKNNYWNKSYKMEQGEYLNNLKSCLMKLKKYMKDHQISQLAMPKIGCGLDGCSWSEVKKIIEMIFQNEQILILVCYL